MPLRVGDTIIGYDRASRTPYIDNLSRIQELAEAKRRATILNTQELAKVGGSRFIQGLPWEAENPNDLIRKEGLAIVTKMLGDDCVKSASKMLALAVISPGFRIDPPKQESPHAEEATEMIRWNLDELPGTFRATEKHLLSGRDYGFAVDELNWGWVEEGPHRGRAALKSIKPKPAEDYRFEVDDYGNVLALLHADAIAESEEEAAALRNSWPAKWMHYAHDAGEVAGSPYGVPQVIPAHDYWKARRIAFRYRGIFVERYGSGHPVATHKPGANPAMVAKLEKLVRRLATGTGIVKSEDVVLDFLEQQGSAHLEFGRFDDHCARAIFRTMLFPSQLGLGPKESVGAQAKATVHQAILKWVMGDMDSDLTTAVNEQPIRRICDVNFELNGSYPIYVREQRDLEDALEIVSAFVGAVDKGAWVEINHADHNKLRQLLGFPEISEEEWEARRQDKKPPLGTGDPEQDRGLPGREKIAEPKKGSTITVPKDLPGTDDKIEQEALAIAYGATWTIAPAGRDFGVLSPYRIERGRRHNPTYMRQLTDYEKAAGLRPREIERFYERAGAEASQRIQNAMRDVRDHVVRKLGRAGLLDGQATPTALWRFGGLDGTAKKAFASTLYATELTAFLEGARDAHGMLKTATGATINLEAEDQVDFQEIGASALLDPREAREYFEGLIPMNKLDALGMRHRAFWITGVYLEDHGTLMAGIKDKIDWGFRTGEWQRVQGRTEELFEEWLGSGRLTPTGQRYTPWHANTIVRNAIARGYNAGAYQVYTSPGAREWMEAYQWSSIVDNRTTEHCEMMDQVVFKHGQVEFPPAHHLCRSMIIPVIKGQSYTAAGPDQLAQIHVLRDVDFTSGISIHV